MVALSIDDFFTVGIGLDLFGGVFLGRGLIAKPDVIMARSGSYIGHSPPTIAGLIESRAEGEIGLSSILFGFALQAAGYLAVLGGNKIETGKDRALFGAGLLVLAICVLTLIAKPLRTWRIRRLAVNVARVGFAGQRETRPEARMLALLGPLLGYPECDATALWVTLDEYAHEHFKTKVTRTTAEDQRREAEIAEKRRREDETPSVPPAAEETSETQ